MVVGWQPGGLNRGGLLIGRVGPHYRPADLSSQRNPHSEFDGPFGGELDRLLETR